jgi:hypothetical protein
VIGPAPKMSVGLCGSGPKIGSSRVHHEIAAMSIQSYSKASNETANPDDAIIRIMRRSSEMERNETAIITDRNKKNANPNRCLEQY